MARCVHLPFLLLLALGVVLCAGQPPNPFSTGSSTSAAAAAADSSSTSTSDQCTASPVVTCSDAPALVDSFESDLSDRISALALNVDLDNLQAYLTAIGDLAQARATWREVCAVPSVCNATEADSRRATLDESMQALIDLLDSAAHPSITDAASRDQIESVATNTAAYLDESVHQEIACESPVPSCDQSRSSLLTDNSQLQSDIRQIVSLYDTADPGASDINAQTFSHVLQSLSHVFTDRILVQSQCECTATTVTAPAAATTSSSGDSTPPTTTDEGQTQTPNTTTTGETSNNSSSSSDSSSSNSTDSCVPPPSFGCSDVSSVVSGFQSLLSDRISDLSSDVQMSTLGAYIFAIRDLAQARAHAREVCAIPLECGTINSADSRATLDTSVVDLLTLVDTHASIGDPEVRAQIVVTATDGAAYLDQAIQVQLACAAQSDTCAQRRATSADDRARFSANASALVAGYNSTEPSQSNISQAQYESVLASLIAALADDILVDSTCRCTAAAAGADAAGTPDEAVTPSADPSSNNSSSADPSTTPSDSSSPPATDIPSTAGDTTDESTPDEPVASDPVTSDPTTPAEPVQSTDPVVASDPVASDPSIPATDSAAPNATEPVATESPAPATEVPSAATEPASNSTSSSPDAPAAEVPPTSTEPASNSTASSPDAPAAEVPSAATEPASNSTSSTPDASAAPSSDSSDTTAPPADAATPTTDAPADASTTPVPIPAAATNETTTTPSDSTATAPSSSPTSNTTDVTPVAAVDATPATAVAPAADAAAAPSGSVDTRPVNGASSSRQLDAAVGVLLLTLAAFVASV